MSYANSNTEYYSDEVPLWVYYEDVNFDEYENFFDSKSAEGRQTHLLTPAGQSSRSMTSNDTSMHASTGSTGTGLNAQSQSGRPSQNSQNQIPSGIQYPFQNQVPPDVNQPQSHAWSHIQQHVSTENSVPPPAPPALPSTRQPASNAFTPGWHSNRPATPVSHLSQSTSSPRKTPGRVAGSEIKSLSMWTIHGQNVTIPDDVDERPIAQRRAARKAVLHNPYHRGGSSAA